MQYVKLLNFVGGGGRIQRRRFFMNGGKGKAIDASTSRSRDVTNITGFWSKRVPKTIEVNGNRVEFCFYFLMYR